MSIQWFPGHMHAARRKAAQALETIDVVIEVVDARAPEASSNPMIHELRMQRQRPCLKLLNKADLADPAVTQAWLACYDGQPGVKAAALSCNNARDAARVPKLCQLLAPHRNSPLKPLRMMIMGIPNVGKSTLMNALLKRRIAQVGDEPAVTKVQQRHDLGDQMTLVDTPGLMWPKIEHEEDGYMLAALHAIGRNATMEEEVAEHLAACLMTRVPGLLTARYGAEEKNACGADVVAAIAKKRGCLKGKGGEPDLEKAALILLTEFRSGKLGRISLETPESRAEMLSKVALGNDPVQSRGEHSVSGT